MNIMSLFWMVILFINIQPSFQKKYLCNPNLECGCSMKPALLTRIVGGEDANEGTWGWTVSLFIGVDSLTTYCGGSIISDSWIITAAHCMENISTSDILVYAGSNTIWSGTQNRTVSKIIMHSEYDSDTNVNDIALLELTSPLNMSDPAVSAICLPSVSSTTLAAGEWPAAKTTVVTVGWGDLKESTQEGSEYLQQVTLQTVDYREPKCDILMQDEQVQLCAGVSDDSKDTCQGDSGGPLMMFTSSKQWVLVGLTSFGYGCARKSYSGVYTRVAAFDDWINLNTNGSYSKSKSFPMSSGRALNSQANTVPRWNYHLYLYILVPFFIYRFFI